MSDAQFMRLALRLAQRGFGATSPNPMVGAVLVSRGKIIGRGWHRRAGEPHAEIEALRDAERRGCSPKGATLYVTLEPCSTHGRTPPCTEAIIAAGVKRLVAGTFDPNPKHRGRAFGILRRAGIEAVNFASPPSSSVLPLRIARGGNRPMRRTPSPPSKDRGRMTGRRLEKKLADACAGLNEAFNHWIIYRTPFPITPKLSSSWACKF